MYNSPPAFGSWLKARRKALDLTQAELAQRIGYSARTLEKLEAGLRRPSREIVPLLAAALGVPDGEREAFAEFARAIEAHAGGWGDGAAPWRTRSLPPTPNNLPAERAGFVGRESILASLSSLLARPEVRLVTLTGPPGVGKTRLSLRLAAQALATFEDGVFFVPLDRVRDPLMVLPAIAQAISAREPTGGRQLLEQLASYLKDKTTLLVLDNFEQVLSAAPPLGDLLSRLPQLKLLVTSRELLNLYGEHNFPVPPLSLPTNDELLTPHSSLLSDYEAVRLFVERATAARPDFTLDDTNARDVAAICVSLDGLPLAIELAAAHIRTMPPRAIAERLGQRLRLLVGGPQDLPSRQQALSAALDWSYDLLDSDERDLFRRLSVFSGGGTLAAIEIVCGPLVPDLLDSLTGKSLLRHEIHNDEPRYSMLETVREYAWEMLVESGEAEEVLGRHAAFFVALADEAFDALSGPDQAAWLRRLEPEHGNLRVALTTLLEREDGEAALRLGVGVWRYWTMHGFNSEGMNWLTRALEIGGDAPLELQGLAYNAAGNLAWSNGALDTAWRLHQQGLGIRRQTGDKLRVASSLNNLGLVAQDRGDFEQARALLEESLQICRALDDKADIASTLTNLGSVYLNLDNPEAAQVMHEEGLGLWREVDDDYGLALSLNNLGEVARYRGDYEEARRLYSDAVAIYGILGFKQGAANTLHNIGYAALRQGLPDEAADSFHEALRNYTEIGDPIGITRSLAGLAGVAGARGDVGKAARLMGISEALKEELGFNLHQLDQDEYRRNTDAARDALGPDRFEDEFRQGRRLNLDAALALAASA